MMKKILPFLIFCILLNCEKINYYPDRPIDTVETKILAHRGGGYCEFPENSLEAARFGLRKLDGIEVDIQISKDRTLWLSHSADFTQCGKYDLNCFCETRDEQIIKIDSCFGVSYRFSKLEDIFKLMTDSFPHSYLALDIKAWEPCKFTSLDIMGVLNATAEEIIKLSAKYDLDKKIMVESEVATFLNFIKKRNNKIGCYLTTLGDFERGMLLALKAGYDGLSFKYGFKEIITADHIKLLHKKGLKIQVWTFDTEEQINKVLQLNPDFIQTNNTNYIKN